MTKNTRILYMEDNEGIARLLQKRLSRAGYTIEIAPNGEIGIEMCATQAYDVIIVDYNMPQLTGLQVIEHLATQNIFPPTIMLTGTGNERIAVEALKLGAVDYVVKDIDGVYLDLLPTVVEQARKNQQLLEDKHRAEEALRESEARFRILFEHAPDVYYINDLKGNFIDGNTAAETMIGVSRSELIGKNMLDLGLLSDEQLPKAAARLYQNARGNTTGPDEFVLYPKNLDPVDIEVRSFPTLIAGEKMVLSIARDITWRKQAEASMKAHIERLEILHQLDDGLTQKLDLDYVLKMAANTIAQFTRANAGGLGIIQDEIVRQIYSFGYPDTLDPEYLLDKPSIAIRVIHQRKAEWVRDVSSDPDYYAILADTCSQIAIPLLSQERLVGVINLESNRPDCFDDETFEFLQLVAARIAVAIDNARLFDRTQKQLSELTTLYERVQMLEQVKSDMIRIVSHDLRNPLSTASISTSLLERSLEKLLGDKQQHYIAQINRAIEQMKTLTTDVLSLENIERMALGDISVKIIDFSKLIHDIVENAQIQAEQKNLALHFSSPDSPILVKAHKSEIQQAVSNLIGNAIKYTPENGSIEVIIQIQENIVRFEVIDTGYGIPEENQAKLFQAFERVRIEETQGIEGTGLGLHIVKKIIDHNNGEIIFSSKYGVGSVFGFMLPLAQE